VIVEGRAVVIPGDDVDTDVMYPGAFLNVEDPEEMKQHLFDGYDPSLRDHLGPESIVVTGRNFGLGSSREHVVQALTAWGVPAVVGQSFARIFRRNCVNLGLAIFEAPEAAQAAQQGSSVRIDTGAGEIVVDGRRFATPPVPELVAELQGAGGLVPWTKERAHDRS
jgi:3-isopropylmalate/(R)-2-methylmalate dehydratase small subunit